MGKYRTLVLFLVIVTLIGFVSSQQESLGVFKQNECIELKQTCASCSYVNFTTVLYPNSSIALGNVLSTKDGTVFTYSFCNTSALGNYIVYGVGDVDGEDTIFAYDFSVTYLGKELNEGSAILYIGFLAILILIFFLNFFAMGFLPQRNSIDEEGRILSINYLKYFRNVLWMTGYFLFIAITFISSNIAFAFLEETLVAQTLFTIYKVSFGLSPLVVIVWMIWIFVSMFHDRQFQNMLNRGIFPGGNL